jgi:hypothetical protein
MAEIRSIQDELSDMMSGFAAKVSVENIPTETPTPTPVAPEIPVVEAEAPKVDTPVTTPEPTVPTETVVENVEEAWSSWDSPEVPTAVPPAVQPTEVYTDLSKALGVEIKSQEDLVKAWNAEKEKTRLPENIPSELKKAIELASKGVDYLEYLKVNTVDYGKADPVELYEDYLIDQFTDEKGEVDADKVDEYLESLSDKDKTIRGKELQRQLVYAQAQRSAQLEQEAQAQREKHDTELKAALRSMAEVDKFKVSDTHRRELFDWISSGKIMKDLFYDEAGQFDAVKVAKIAFRNKYYDKLDAYQKTLIRNSTKREVLSDITNQQITTPPRAASPETKKGFGADDYIAMLEQRMSNR